MIAKLIVKRDSREEAIVEMKQALDNYVVEGIKTNIPLLKKVTAHDAFLHGDTTTNFIENYLQNKTSVTKITLGGIENGKHCINNGRKHMENSSAGR